MVGFGFTLTAGAVLLLVLMSHDDRPLLLTVGFVLLGFGLQTTLFGAYESMLSEAPAECAGGAAAIGETSYQLGAGMGIALLGSVMNAAYAPGLTGVPGVPDEAAAAAPTRWARRTRWPPGSAARPARPCRRPRATPSSTDCTSPWWSAPCCCSRAPSWRCGCRAPWKRTRTRRTPYRRTPPRRPGGHGAEATEAGAALPGGRGKPDTDGDRRADAPCESRQAGRVPARRAPAEAAGSGRAAH